MPRYYNKCPKCNHDLDYVCTWDIVTEEYCDLDRGGCGWSKEYGYVAGPPGMHYLVEYDDYDDYVYEDSFEEEYVIISCVTETVHQTN